MPNTPGGFGDANINGFVKIRKAALPRALCLQVKKDFARYNKMGNLAKQAYRQQWAEAKLEETVRGSCRAFASWVVVFELVGKH